MLDAPLFSAGRRHPAVALRRRAPALVFGCLLAASAHAADAPKAPPVAPLRIEAESGKLGAGLQLVSSGTLKAISAKSNIVGTAPLEAQRVSSYRVTFKAPGA